MTPPSLWLVAVYGVDGDLLDHQAFWTEALAREWANAFSSHMEVYVRRYDGAIT